MRELFFSDEFWEFYHAQQDNVKRKFDYVIGIVREERVIATKFVKHLEKRICTRCVSLSEITSIEPCCSP